jgi:hypothetical protein
MRNTLACLLLCYLTQPVVCVDLQKNATVTIEKGQRIQIIHTKDNKTIFAINNNYFQIDDDKLTCR